MEIGSYRQPEELEMSSEDNREGIRLSEEGAMTTVEKVSSYNLPDVFGGSEPESLQRMAERLEDRIEELSENPMQNRNEIQDLAFKAILLTSMADEDSSFRGGRLDDEDAAQSDERSAGDDRNEDRGEQSEQRNNDEQSPDDLEELGEQVEEGDYEEGEGADNRAGNNNQQGQNQGQQNQDEDAQDQNNETDNEE